MGNSGNIGKHLKDHANKQQSHLLEWINAYYESLNRKHKYFNENTLTLCKYFISSNQSLSNLRNPHLLKLLKIDIPSDQSFTRTILPKIFNNLTHALEWKLVNALCICITSDIWTTKALLDFLAICATLSSFDYTRETIVIGMVQMPGNHNAENVKEAIEEVVNKFEFDKSKISATVSDQGSAYVRLFKQIQNSTSAASNNSSTFSLIDFSPDNEDQEEEDNYNENDLMCFDDQVDNNLVNYDYADREEFDPNDNCEINSSLSNVNLEIDEAWNDAIRVPITSPITIAQAVVILTNDVLFQLELAEFDDEYEPIRNLGCNQYKKTLSIQLGNNFYKKYLNLNKKIKI